MSKWKRWTLLALTIALALAVDAWVSCRLTTRRLSVRAASATPAQSTEEGDPLARFRLEREQLRARLTAQLNDIAHDDDSGEELAASARRQLLDLAARTESETTLEGVLRARGFEDAVVTVSERSANVLLRRETLTRAETAVILELVMRETGLTGGNVKIIPVN